MSYATFGTGAETFKVHKLADISTNALLKAYVSLRNGDNEITIDRSSLIGRLIRYEVGSGSPQWEKWTRRNEYGLKISFDDFQKVWNDIIDGESSLLMRSIREVEKSGSVRKVDSWFP